MNKKKLRNILLPIVIIAVIVACYVGYFMRTQPLLDCWNGTDITSTGEITRYDEAHKDGVSLGRDQRRPGCPACGRPSRTLRSASSGAGAPRSPLPAGFTMRSP